MYSFVFLDVDVYRSFIKECSSLATAYYKFADWRESSPLHDAFICFMDIHEVHLDFIKCKFNPIIHFEDVDPYENYRLFRDQEFSLILWKGYDIDKLNSWAPHVCDGYCEECGHED